jgi:ABC-type glycerol-3-phosphate transport system substrate-binding protein
MKFHASPRGRAALNALVLRPPPIAVLAIAAVIAAATAGCGGTSTSGSTGYGAGATITYWASDQGSSIADDYTVLNPQLQKFTKQTGIKVKLEVIGWPDLLNRILAATTSGQGPDVVNIGNTWSASLQATGALLPWTSQDFAAIGGENRFVASALGSTGAAGKPPAAVPLYSVAYALYYNKALFRQAGIAGPPVTWADLIADGKKLTRGGVYGLAIEGGSTPENIHHAFIFAQQHGCSFFSSSGAPTFTGPGCVQGVWQFVNLMGTDKIVSPGDAEYDQNQSVSDFASGKVGMLMWQAAGANLQAHGMSPSQYGIAPVPVQSGAPGQGTSVDSMVAGINIAIFKNTHNLTAAEKFVQFMTSAAEQMVLCKEYGSIPPVSAAQQNPAFATPELSVLRNVLATSALAMPQVAGESQFEQLVGTAVKNLFADAVAGPVSAQTVEQQLASAQQQMTG